VAIPIYLYRFSMSSPVGVHTYMPHHAGHGFPRDHPSVYTCRCIRENYGL
jgi:hypothetical protein